MRAKGPAKAASTPRSTAARVFLLLLSALTLGAAGSHAICDRLFFDGFETGDLTGWTVWRPAPCTSWQWQLTGTIDTSFDVEMYDIDLFDVPIQVGAYHFAAGRCVPLRGPPPAHLWSGSPLRLPSTPSPAGVA